MHFVIIKMTVVLSLRWQPTTCLAHDYGYGYSVGISRVNFTIERESLRQLKWGFIGHSVLNSEVRSLRFEARLASDKEGNMYTYINR